MTDDASERRRAERVAVNAEFGNLPGLVHVSDLSEHGVFVHTERLPSLGAIVSVRFTVLLDDPVVIAARGRVVRHQFEPRGVGIEFTHLSPDMVLRIGDVVTHQRPQLLAEAVSRRTSPPPPPGGNTRVTRPPQPPGDTKVVTAPTVTPATASPSQPAPEPEEFDANQTLVKLQAVDLEILDDDDEFDHDPGASGPRGPTR